MAKPKYPEVYKVIIDILQSNGFKDNGKTIDRDSTGCQFDFGTLNKYESVLDFQLDWPYAFPDKTIVKRFKIHAHKADNLEVFKRQVNMACQRYPATSLEVFHDGDDFVQNKMTVVFYKER